MTTDEQNKVTEALANSILNTININGILDAMKIYSMNLANKQYDEMSAEDKEKILETIRNHEKEVAQGAAAPVGHGHSEDMAVG